MDYNLKLPKVGDLLKQSVELYKSKFNTLIQLSLIVFVLTVLTEILFPVQMVDGKQVGSPAYAIATLVVSVISVIVTIAMVYVIAENLDLKAALNKAPGKFWSYLWVSILVGLTVMVGFILLIVPGILFSFWYAFAGIIVLLEGLKGTGAMKQSKEYVKGHIGELFWRGFVLGVIALIIMIPAMALSKNAMAANLYTALVMLFGLPFVEIYLYMLYKHLKEMKSQPQPAVAVTPPPHEQPHGSV